jgi:hypothetical protein
MKKTLLLLLFPVLVYSQKEEVVYKKLANQTCDCVNEKKTEKISELELGLCVISSLGKLSDKEKKTIKYDVASDTSLDKVSEQIGMQMVSVCPDVFSNMLQTNASVEEPATDDYVPDPSFTGVFETSITNEFKSIVVIDDANQKREFIWLFPFDGDVLLIKNKILKGDKINISYREQNFFDPKKNEYRMYNEILSIELL